MRGRKGESESLLRRKADAEQRKGSDDRNLRFELIQAGHWGGEGVSYTFFGRVKESNKMRWEQRDVYHTTMQGHLWKLFSVRVWFIFKDSYIFSLQKHKEASALC